jgi:hypothetical protein
MEIKFRTPHAIANLTHWLISTQVAADEEAAEAARGLVDLAHEEVVKRGGALTELWALLRTGRPLNVTAGSRRCSGVFSPLNHY